MDLMQELEATANRVMERAEALAAFHKIPAINQAAAVVVTLDGVFEVIIGLASSQPESKEEASEIGEALASVVSEAMALCLRNVLSAANVPDDAKERVAPDVLRLVEERRQLQERIYREEGGL